MGWEVSSNHDWWCDTSKWIENNFPKVFVDEGEKDYTISLAAPGVNKTDFDLNLVQNTLRLTYKTTPDVTSSYIGWVLV